MPLGDTQYQTGTYRGYDVMPWCGRCGVGLSEMEMKEGYKLVEHKSVFVKFPLKERFDSGSSFPRSSSNCSWPVKPRVVSGTIAGGG